MQKNQHLLNTTRSYTIPHILVHVGPIFVAVNVRQLLLRFSVLLKKLKRVFEMLDVMHCIWNLFKFALIAIFQIHQSLFDLKTSCKAPLLHDVIKKYGSQANVYDVNINALFDPNRQ